MHNRFLQRICIAALSAVVLTATWAIGLPAAGYAGSLAMVQLDDFSDKVKATWTESQYDPGTGLYTVTITIKNTQIAAVEGTLAVVLKNLTPGVSQTNAGGSIQGDPYTLVFGGLNSNNAISLRASFSNPDNAEIAFTPAVYQLISGGVNARAVRALTRPFTIAAIPDTQFYARDGLVEFEKQVEWVLAHASDWNIGFVVHLGDIVDEGDSESQWTNAMNALDPLLKQAEVPFSIIRGNHDDPGYYLDNLPPESMQKMPWFIGADPTGMTRVQVFRVENACILHVGFQKDPTPGELAWANALLARPELEGLPVIVSTHDYIDGGGLSPAGQNIWKNFVKNNPMVFMVLNGHSSTEYALVSRNAENKPVYQLLSDYQNRRFGGNGLMRLITVDPDQSKIVVQTFSPWFRTQKDGPVEPSYFETDENSRFEYALDIRERLAFDTDVYFEEASLRPQPVNDDYARLADLFGLWEDGEVSLRNIRGKAWNSIKFQ